MSLKARIGKGLVKEAGGFCFEEVPVESYTEIDAFKKAIKVQSDCTAMVDTTSLNRLDVDGKVEGTSWRLSAAAFGDLCHWTKMPVSFIKRLAVADEQMALQVVETVIDRFFHPGPEKLFVIDTRTGRIDGIVGKESFKPITNSEVVDLAMSATSTLKLCEGWLAGPNMRITATLTDKPAEPRKGDIVMIGTSLENSINGDCSLKVCDYANRLVCTNGMTAREGFHMDRVVHRGDIQGNTIKAIIKSASRAELMIPIMNFAATRMLDEKDVRSVRHFISEPSNGGSETLFKGVAQKAMNEAKVEGRSPEEVTLWNMVNGVTEMAHETESLNRRIDLESLGYKTLVKFGAILQK